MFGPEDYEAKDDPIKDNQIKMQQRIPEAQEMSAPVPAQNQRFGDFIVKYSRSIHGVIDDSTSEAAFQGVDEIFGIVYIPLDQLEPLEVDNYSYNSIPKCYTYMDLGGLEASGVNQINNHPYLQLRGKGTAVAIIDSGIDYRHPAFLDENGRTRILYIWDQSLVGNKEQEGVPYGRLFREEDINEALQSENPLEIVPSMDENGHGTAMAGIAAGNLVQVEGFSGAAPEAKLIVVKLKPAKIYLREFYLFPQDAEVFQENDIMLGVSVAFALARNEGLPVSMCVGLGTSQGGHMGESPLSQYISYIMGFSRAAVTVPAGNEGAARHHFRESLTQKQPEKVVELRVGEKENGFVMELWGEPPEIFEVSIQSPAGEILKVSTSLGSGTQTLSFVFVETKILINYISIERVTGYPLIYFRFMHPAAGIWKLRVGITDGQDVNFHIWLPVQGLVDPDTYFLESSPSNTVTAPGDARGGITVTAYDYRDNALYLQAGRGYTIDGMVTPQLAAPGVNMRVPLVGGTFGIASGTSLGAAQTAGIVALLFEWALVRENEQLFSGTSAKYYLQRGADRDEREVYPNPEWGYGRINLYHTFELLS